jgi:phage terminase small subunit
VVSLSPDAAAVYKRLTKDLAYEPAEDDKLTIEAYAACTARAESARAMVDKDGPVIADAKGQPVQHPALAVERQAMEDMRKWDPLLSRVLKGLRD